MKRPFYNAIRSLFCNPRHFVAALLYRFGGWIPDETYLRIIYWLNLKEPLSLDNPKKFTEKLQWLKLNYRHPQLTSLVDKLEVKKIVANIIGEEYVIPTLGSWSSVEEIEWDKLPNQFVLKTNHDGGNFGVVICKDKKTFDKKKAMRRLNQSLHRSSYLLGREWPYKHVNRCIFAEQYIEDVSVGELVDYKFFCFEGTPRFLYIASGRQGSNENARFDYYDLEFNHLDILQSGRKNSIVSIPKPICFNEMISIAEKLSSVLVNDKKIPHVRVDLYQIDGKIYFGEYTFFHSGGLAEFYPQKYDSIFGDYIILPEKFIENN
jgi:hypothetical protein